MKRYSKLIPQGTRDLLFEECDDRRNVESILSALFKEYNYRKVMTPTVEFLMYSVKMTWVLKLKKCTSFPIL